MSIFDLARRALPRHRRWEGLLHSLTIEPGVSPPHFDSPGPNDFIICGSSRSGTSLLCAALYQPPTCVTVMEPWDAMRFPPAELFQSLRGEIEEGFVTRGRLDVEGLADGSVHWGRDGDFPHHVEVNAGYLLGIKFPAFWRYLEYLPATRFLVCLRHPIEVISSFKDAGGRLAHGLDYDVAFNRSMNEELRGATDDDALRRVLMYEYVNSRLAPHLERPNVFAVRYERWFSDRDGLMREIAEFLEAKVGPGHPLIRPPKTVTIDPELVRLIEAYCPSAAMLGYDVRVMNR
jgi:hypothetical protein